MEWIYCTSKNLGPESDSSSIMLYLGPSVEEAEKAVGSFTKYQKEEKDFPTNYLDIYSAIPRNMERELIQYFTADGWWYSIVRFKFDEVR